MASSSRHWMPLVCDCWMELAWEAPQVSASLIAVEQWASAFLDRVSTVGLCFPDGMGAESLCFLDGLLSFGLVLAGESYQTQKVISMSVGVNRGLDHQPVSPRPSWPLPRDGQCLRKGCCCWALWFWLYGSRWHGPPPGMGSSILASSGAPTWEDVIHLVWGNLPSFGM